MILAISWAQIIDPPRGQGDYPDAWYDSQCTVTRIVDGDTIECNKAQVRFRSIDAPEIWDAASPAAGNAARAQLMQLLPIGSIVGLSIDSERLADSFGRVLADVYLLGLNNDSDIQEAMVRSGHARYRED
jgi:endonuclease YncB( thermonuclease family)